MASEKTSSTPPDRGGDTTRQPELSFTAHRGVYVPELPFHRSRTPGVGLHWSASQKIAEEMSSHAQQETINRQVGNRLQIGTTGSHVIYHGEIPMSSVESDWQNLYNRGVFSPSNLNENREQEVPVKKGAPVLVTGRTKGSLRNGVLKTRKRTYNPPREMKA
jgi:hypothetical protein